jgi:hypothetical protein
MVPGPAGLQPRGNAVPPSMLPGPPGMMPPPPPSAMPPGAAPGAPPMPGGNAPSPDRRDASSWSRSRGTANCTNERCTADAHPGESEAQSAPAQDQSAGDRRSNPKHRNRCWQIRRESCRQYRRWQSIRSGRDCWGTTTRLGRWRVTIWAVRGACWWQIRAQKRRLEAEIRSDRRV